MDDLNLRKVASGQHRKSDPVSSTDKHVLAPLKRGYLIGSCNVVHLVFLLLVAQMLLSDPLLSSTSVNPFPGRSFLFPAGGGNATDNITIPASAEILSTTGILDPDISTETVVREVDLWNGTLENVTAANGSMMIDKVDRSRSFSIHDLNEFCNTKIADNALQLSYSNRTIFKEQVKVDDISDNSGRAYPSIVVDGNGTIFVVWDDKRTGNWSIFFSESGDGGSSFDRNKKLSDDTEIGSIYPLIITLDNNENPHIIWTRLYNYGTVIETHHRFSQDNGDTFNNSNLVGNYLVSSVFIDSLDAIHVSGSNKYSKSIDNGVTFSDPINMDNLANVTIYQSNSFVKVDREKRIHGAFSLYSPPYGFYYTMSENYGNSFDCRRISDGWVTDLLIGQNGEIYLIWWNATAIHISQIVGNDTIDLWTLDWNTIQCSASGIDSDNNIHIAWVDDGIVHTIFNTTSKQWNLERIAFDLNSPPGLFIDKNDTIHFVYDFNNSIYYVKGNRGYTETGVAISPIIGLDTTPSNISIDPFWNQPPGTVIEIFFQTSRDNISWTGWLALNDISKTALGRYLKIKFVLSTNDPLSTPSVTGFNISYSYFQPRGIILSKSIITKEQIISSSVMVRSALNNQSISILISNDDAEHWYEVGANSTFSFPTKGNDLVVKIILASDGSESPLVEGISVRLIVESFPTNVKVDIGSDGITDWSWNGTFDTIAVLPDFSDILNGYMNTHRNISVNGSVIIPLKFSSDTCGVLNLTDININYNSPPEFVSREPSERSIQALENSSNHFTISVIDKDGDTLRHHWYLDGTLVGNDSNTFNYRTDFDSSENHTLRVEVSDGHFGLNSSWDINVRNVNRPPVVQAFSPVSPVMISIGSSRRFNVTAMDPDGDAIGFSWSLDGSERTGNASEFMLKAGNLAPGKHILRVRITDGIGYTDQIWVVNVKEKIEVGSGPLIYIFLGLLVGLLVLSTLFYYYFRRKTVKPGG